MHQTERKKCVKKKKEWNKKEEKSLNRTPTLLILFADTEKFDIYKYIF